MSGETDVQAWLAAASERAAEYIRWGGEQEVERGLSMHDGSREEAQASTAATEANTERDARAILLLPSAVRALAPFAALAALYDDGVRRPLPDKMILILDFEGDVKITLGDCRAAARVLSDLEALAAREGEAGRG